MLTRKPLLIILSILFCLALPSGLIFAQDQDSLPPPEVEITEVNYDEEEQSAEETEEAVAPEEEQAPADDEASKKKQEDPKKTVKKPTSRSQGFQIQSVTPPESPANEKPGYASEPVPDAYVFTGAATHNIPIKVLPGRNGLSPRLNLSYNSFMGNSWVGLGWNLDFGSIRRSTKRGLNYDDNIHFVINGEELVPRSAWGENYFGLKIENGFAKYYFNPVDKFWTVTAKNGTKYFYGSTPASRQEFTSGVTTYTYKWNLDKIQDTNGNYLEITYTKDQGELYPDEIRYTGHSQLAPANKVKFILETRPDPLVFYHTQTKTTLAKRLDKIEIYNKDNALFRVYDLTYEDPQTVSGGLSRLAQVEIVGSDNSSKLPPLSMTYYNGSMGLFNEYQAGSGPGSVEPGYLRFADLNGDNADDMIRWDADGKVYTALSDKDGTFGEFQTIEGPAGKGAGYLNLADINADGKADLIKHAGDGNVYYALSNGDGTFIGWGNHSGPGGAGENLVQLADINGDGLADLIKSTSSGDVYVYTSGTTDVNGYTQYLINSNSMHTAGPGGGAGRFMLVDVNGDGYADLVKTATDSANVYVFLSNGIDGFLSQYKATATPSGVTLTGYLNFGDVNGDGLVDLVKHTEGGTVYVLLSKGDGTFDTNSISHSGSGGEGPGLVQIVDVNNDGYADLVKQSSDGTKVYIYFATGNGGFESTYRLHEGPGGGTNGIITFSDLNADSLPDLIKTTGEGVYYNYLAQGWGSPKLLQNAAVLNGASLSLEYGLSSEYPNKVLPFVLPLVKSITTDDGLGNLSTETFAYSGGLYDFQEREFRGFKTMVQRNPDNTLVESHFFQDKYYQGMTEFEYFKDPQGTTLSWQHNIFETSWLDQDNGIGFARLKEKYTEQIDDQTVFTRELCYYDDENQNGNLVKTITSGTGADPVIKEFQYENKGASQTDWVWRKTQEVLKNEQGITLRKVTDDWQQVTGNLTSETAWLDGSAEQPQVFYDYDVFGNLTKITNARGYYTTFEYDPETKTYPVKITKPETNNIQHVEAFGINFTYGKAEWSRDENNNQTNYYYDVFGRRTQMDLPDGGQTGYFYYDYVRPRYLVTRVRENSQDSFIDAYQYYDGLGRSVQAITFGENNKSIVSQMTYDEMGRVVKQAGPFFSTGVGYPKTLPAAYPFVVTEYDYRSRPIRVMSPHGDYPGEYITTQFYYSGLATTVVDPDNGKKTEIKDYLGRTVEVIEYSDLEQIHTTYKYNLAGDLLEVTNHEGVKTVLEYDTLGRKKSMQDPDMGYWTYEYDLNGNLETQTDAKGQVTAFNYDALDRVLTKTTNGTNATSYVYDNTSILNGKGRLYSVTRGNTIIRTDAYDSLGRATSATQVIDGTAYNIGTQYDLSGKTTRITYPDGYQVNYTYYPGTALFQAVKGPNQVEHAVYLDYEPTGKIGQISYSNGTATKYTYDAWSTKLFGIVTEDPTHNPQKDLMNKTYKYSRAGDILRIQDNVRAVTYFYTYDRLHRLTGETADGDNLPLTTNVTVLDLKYNDPSHTHAVTQVQVNLGTEYTYTYDPNGNMVTSPDLTNPDQVADRAIQYDADNMPVQITKGSLTVGFTYDGLGARIKKAVSGGSTILYIGAYYEVKDSIITKYIFGGNLRLAVIKGSLTYYYHKDHLGSTGAVTDSTGAKVESAEYHPFGTMREHTGSNVSDYKYKFTDQELDNETGLYNYDARLYDPVLGMFVTPEPFQSPNLALTGNDLILRKRINNFFYIPQLLNRYTYCLNNPLKYIDPDGFKPYDRFSSPEEAAKDFGMTYGDDSIRNNVEYGAAIFENDDGSHSYSTPRKGDDHSVDPSDPPGPTKEEDGKSYSGGVHTHGAYDPNYENNKVSDPDKDYARANKAPEFVVGTNGSLQKFDPTTGQTTTISTDMPSDPNDPTRLNNVDPNTNPKDDKSTTVVCTELFRQGLMDKDIYLADAKFGAFLSKNYPIIITGYHFFAKPIVKLMQASKLITYFVSLVAKPWSYEMAHVMGARQEGDFIGEKIMFIGIPFCYFLGKLTLGELNWIFICFSLFLILIIFRQKIHLIKLDGLKLFIIASFFLCAICNNGFTEDNKIKNWSLEKDGYVSNEETAIKIAEAVWLCIYGEKIYKQKPFTAQLAEDNIWIVKGTLKKGYVGGVVYAKIRRSNGEILSIYHTK